MTKAVTLQPAVRLPGQELAQAVEVQVDVGAVRIAFVTMMREIIAGVLWAVVLPMQHVFANRH